MPWRGLLLFWLLCMLSLDLIMGRATQPGPNARPKC
ncbi:hypothetical protein Gotur_000372, partial [Gossypium turneri]